MENSLTRILTSINANIESRDAIVLSLNVGFHFVQQCVNRIEFGLIEFKIARHMSLRDYKRV